MNRLQDCFDDDAGDVSEGPFFQGMRHDPDCPLFERTRAMSPTLANWVDQEPAAYVDGLNAYNAPVDEPVNPIHPPGT